MSDATARWFGPPERPLFGWLHTPSGGQARGAVVLCAPLAREHTSAHYTYRLLAESLARAGLLAVRFDYDGTGDSAGGDDDPGRVEAWLSSIGEAVDLARRSGAESVSIVGMRMGALLGAVWAARTGGVESLVLWDPCVSGRAFVKEQRALQRLRTDAPSSVTDGAAELPGFVLRADTVADLGALAIEPGPGRAVSHVLLCTREDRPPASELLEILGCPDEARLRADGQADLLDVEPLFHEVPTETLEQISQWLADVHSGPERRLSIAPQSIATWSGGVGSKVTERVVPLGPIGLFGIETTGEPATDRPSVLFLNSGNDWHVGPNRLWVTLARRWAQAGYRCVRFDQSGLGDSPVHPGQAPHTIWAPEAFDDVADVVAAVSPADLTDVVLAGLCSGGYQALESALWFAPRGVLAINPVLRFDPPELAAGRLDPRRKICRPTNPLVSSYRALAVPALRRRLGALAWRLANAANPNRSPRHWLAQLVADGVDTYCICGEDEARPLTEGTGLEALQAQLDSCLHVDVVPGLDHALMAADQRALVADRLTEHLFGRFGAATLASPECTATLAQLSIG